MGANAPGSHADFIKVPVSAILPMPPGLSYLAAAAISCGTGTAWGALHRLGVRAEDKLAIFGQGPVGLAATQIASTMGIEVIALDVSAFRLERARDFGATHVLDPSATDSVVDTIRDLTGGRGVSKSLETSGASSAAQAALGCLDTWGTACWVGLGSTINFDISEHLYRQVTGLVSWTMSIPAMEACARYVVERSVNVDALFTEQWSLPDAEKAYRLFDQQTSGKAAFVPKPQRR
jgi:threonine dehydrogenase-like Zn-dependent dehydrogenase